MTDKELKKATELQEMANDAECKCEFFRPLLGAGCIRIGNANQSLATGTIINLMSEDPDDQELIISTRNALSIIANALYERAKKKFTAFYEYNCEVK